MTDRLHSLTVVLEKDLRDDDAEALINAIKQLRGVLTVDPHVSDFISNMAQNRAKAELRERIWSILK